VRCCVGWGAAVVVDGLCQHLMMIPCWRFDHLALPRREIGPLRVISFCNPGSRIHLQGLAQQSFKVGTGLSPSHIPGTVGLSAADLGLGGDLPPWDSWLRSPLLHRRIKRIHAGRRDP